jgi:small subunit ribosomal protein S14
MARLSLRIRARQPQKYKVREYTRCELCGRPRAVYQKFKVCRLCFRKMAHEGRIPGVRKASW